MTGTESWATSAAVRRSMLANRSRDTQPELAVRRLLHRHGLRYRVCHRPLPRLRATADIVFTRQRVAVFIDGCFWHACQDHFRAPAANADYWRAKIDRNRARDEAVNQTLGEAGWTVLRFWSHEPPEAVAAQVEAAVRGSLGRCQASGAGEPSETGLGPPGAGESSGAGDETCG
ncbi:MAG: very short patch repair endonuclease [Propionibacteriaceae bacterium]|jgi:DNA mismatch endonuclease (patch repair protein)|nr:very short patch repair endonuclease [Propionibacteriaceae bacterium]